VGVDVDEARRDDEIADVDRAGRRLVDLTDRDNSGSSGMNVGSFAEMTREFSL